MLKHDKLIMAILIVVIAVLIFIIISDNADEKLAAEILSKAAFKMSDPSSLRLVSGELIKKDFVELYVVISANNGYGDRIERMYYMIYSENLDEVEITQIETPHEDDGDYNSMADLNIAEVNKRLEEALKQYD